MRRFAALATAGLAALALSACGSDGSDKSQPKAADTAPATSTAPKADSTGNGQVKPKKRAPASAGDKKPNAPDKGISDRPGGPSKPAKP